MAEKMYAQKFVNKADSNATRRWSEKAAKFSQKTIVVTLSVVLILFVCAVCIDGGNVQSNHGRRMHEALKDRAQISSNVVESACGATLYPDVCVSTLLSRTESSRAGSTTDVASIAVTVAIDEVKTVSALASAMSAQPLDQIDQLAIEVCIELFGHTLRQLNESCVTLMNLKGKPTTKQAVGDVRTWLSASLSNQETCIDGFAPSNGKLKSLLIDRLQNVSKLVSNSLSIATSISIVGNGREDVAVPSRNRRLLSRPTHFTGGSFDDEFLSNNGFMGDDFPVWLSSADRKLLQAPQGGVQADAVVAQDSSGNYKTITEAVDAAPSRSNGRYVIHVKAGIYKESLVVSKDHIMLIGDGKDVTVVTGSKSVDGISTKFTAIFAATGKGFIARDMRFENTAGPAQHQAVALRVGSDQSAFYRCSIRGYQDTLYAHSQRQFYRECDIYGTVDFIFGNAAAVFQSCNLFVRTSGSGHKNFITAQGRTDPNQNTGFSIHNCRVAAASDLSSLKSSTYLGRPWKQYSRTVYLQSILGDLINPAGWYEWSDGFALNTLYYGEYMNSGPGADTSGRVKWPGYRVITSSEEANEFTVAEFIVGSSWLPSTGIVFQAGLSG